MDGDMSLPVTATRSGWASLPSLIPTASAVLTMASWMASVLPRLDAGEALADGSQPLEAAGLRCLRAAFSEYSSMSP